MTVLHCMVRVDDLDLALQKVSPAQHPDVSSPLSGVRFHVLDNSLHLTATDDNIRGAIYHLPVTGIRDVRGVVPARFHPDVLQMFAPRDVVTIGTDGSDVIVVGRSGRTLRWRMGAEAAFTLGCFAGEGDDWRVMEPGRYWLRGAVQPARPGAANLRAYASEDIFEEAYDEEEAEDVAPPPPVVTVLPKQDVVVGQSQHPSGSGLDGLPFQQTKQTEVLRGVADKAIREQSARRLLEGS